MTFETEAAFINHYTVKYGGGIGNSVSRQALRLIIGDKRFTTPICVDDECTIVLISGIPTF